MLPVLKPSLRAIARAGRQPCLKQPVSASVSRLGFPLRLAAYATKLRRSTRYVMRLFKRHAAMLDPCAKHPAQQRLQQCLSRERLQACRYVYRSCEQQHNFNGLRCMPVISHLPQ